MKVLVVGHGAREHAIAKKLAQEELEIVSAMSRLNPGIAALSGRVELFDIDDPAEYERFKDLDLAFVGPEAPLATGVSDRLWELGVPVVGPRKALARPGWSGARRTPGRRYKNTTSPGTPSSRYAEAPRKWTVS